MNIRLIDEYNDGGHLIYAEELTGAFVRGRTREEALEKLAVEVRRWCRWRKIAPPSPILPEIIAEKHSGLQICDADSDIIFPSEREPLTMEEYLALKALALASARDFLALYKSIPDKDGTRLPERETFYGAVPRSARQMYNHTKQVNAYYFGEIEVAADNKVDILSCRERGFAQLEHTPDFLRNDVTEGSYGEEWSVRKVCRRFVWHDRIHAKAMYRMARALCGGESIADPFFFGAE